MTRTKWLSYDDAVPGLFTLEFSGGAGVTRMLGSGAVITLACCSLRWRPEHGPNFIQTIAVEHSWIRCFEKTAFQVRDLSIAWHALPCFASHPLRPLNWALIPTRRGSDCLHTHARIVHAPPLSGSRLRAQLNA